MWNATERLLNIFPCVVFEIDPMLVSPLTMAGLSRPSRKIVDCFLSLLLCLRLSPSLLLCLRLSLSSSVYASLLLCLRLSLLLCLCLSLLLCLRLLRLPLLSLRLLLILSLRLSSPGNRWLDVLWALRP